MAAAASTANTNTNTNSRHLTESLDSPTGQQSRRAAATASPPWNQIVRGESEPIAATPSSLQSRAAIEQQTSASSSSPPLPDEDKSENGGGAYGNAGKKPAWNRPSNGAAEVGPVMGAAEAWPALSESARTPSNKSSDSLKSLSEGSSSVPVSQRQVSNNSSTYSGGNYSQPARTRSFKRNNTIPSTNGGLPHSPAQGTSSEGTLNSWSPRVHSQKNGSGSQSHGGNDHQQHRNSFRNHNSGPHSRGDGSHHQNHGNRRNQDHGNQSWSSHRSFGGRDAHMQPQRGLPRFMVHPPPPISTPFIASPPVRPFSPIGFPEVASPMYYVQPLPTPPPEPFRGVPFVAPMAPVFYPVPDPQLDAKILNQIHFYFSDENLIKDVFLRKNMDAHGWVSIELIAGFKKVEALTKSVQLILNVLQSSSLIEVQGDKIRRRNDWPKWLIPKSVQFPDTSSPHSMGRPDNDILARDVQNISLEPAMAGNDSGKSEENQREASSPNALSEPLSNEGASRHGSPSVATVSATKSN